MRSRSVLVSLALLAALAGSAGLSAAASATCSGEGVRSTLQTEAAISQSLLCLVNEERSAAGLGPVDRNAKLEQAAMGHSLDMVANGYFAHTSPGGVDFVQRISSTGYTIGLRGWLAGENLAWGSGSLSAPAEVVSGWMGSPAHRDNLLQGRFREIGIAVVRGTPVDASDPGGITVTSEYGYRGGKSKKKAESRAQARKRSAKNRAQERKRSAKNRGAPRKRGARQ